MEQSPLSRTIRQLEADLGVTLLERMPRGVCLTPAGRVFLEEARRVYPAPPDNTATWHICLSHNKRRRLNHECQSRLAATVDASEKVWVDGETPYECFAGTKLVGANNTMRPIVNGAFLEVVRLGPAKETAILRDEEIGGPEFEVTIRQLIKHTKLRHALTLTSVQGRTLTGTVTIHDCDSPHYEPTHLYVGTSRATSSRDVSIERS